MPSLSPPLIHPSLRALAVLACVAEPALAQATRAACARRPLPDILMRDPQSAPNEQPP
jgi:hypothetical protein